MIAPPKLKPGDAVALLAPARRPADSYIKALCQALEKHGLKPYVDPQVYAKMLGPDGKFGQLAGTDDIRASAFNQALKNPALRAIFFPRAGTGSYRILDKIDYEAARTNPKIIVGYSDVDSLLNAISQRSGLITFRGPLGVNFANPRSDPRTEQECFELLTGKRTSWLWPDATVLHEGNAQGLLVGGNLAVLNANIGTPFDVDTDNKIVILEECDELLFRLDRFLYQASAAGKFAKAKAVLFGTVENMLDGEQHNGTGSPFGIDLTGMLRQFIPAKIPLACNLPLGHGPWPSSHPLGAPARVEITKSQVKLSLLTPAVS